MHKLRKEFISTAAGVNYGCWRKAHFQFSPSQATSQPQPVLPSSCLAHCMKTPSAQNANDTQLFISCSNIFEKLFLSNTCTASHTHTHEHTQRNLHLGCAGKAVDKLHTARSRSRIDIQSKSFSLQHQLQLEYMDTRTGRGYTHPSPVMGTDCCANCKFIDCNKRQRSLKPSH